MIAELILAFITGYITCDMIRNIKHNMISKKILKMMDLTIKELEEKSKPTKNNK